MAAHHEPVPPPVAALRWFALGISALGGAGALALVLVFMRLPGVASAARLDPELVRRCLVVHVDLATGVWFFATIAGLARLAGVGARQPRFESIGVTLATAGVILFLASALYGATAVLSDYVPVLDDRGFLAGIAVFAIGVAVETVWWRPQRERWIPLESEHGIRAAGVTFAIALVTIAAAHVSRGSSVARDSSYQQLFWGGGHVLQFAATAAMLGSWLLLYRQAVGTRALSSRSAALLFALLVAPTTLAPFLVLTGQPPTAFTRLMELGIFPVVAIFTTVGAARARRHRRTGDLHWPMQQIAARGLLVGIGMTVVGFVLGAAIRGNTTLTPAHYHVSIGAVTVSFMTTLLVLMPRFGIAIAHPRAATWQPVLYGGGQTLFALGLAAAGFWGHAGRKLYGAHPLVHTPAERIGWIVAGLGGLVAFAGGILFIAIVVGSTRQAAAMRHYRRSPTIVDRSG